MISQYKKMKVYRVIQHQTVETSSSRNQFGMEGAEVVNKYIGSYGSRQEAEEQIAKMDNMKYGYRIEEEEIS